MIKNEKQYKISKSQENKFKDSLNILESVSKKDKVQTIIRKAQIDAIKSQLEELREQISEYESLKVSKNQTFTVSSLTDIPSILIKARIASGLTQNELAKLLNLKEQQIQRYEINDYSSVSMSKMLKIAETLGIEIKGDAFIEDKIIDLPIFLSRLDDIGISKELLTKRILPIQLSNLISKKTIEKKYEKTIIQNLSSLISNIFKIPENSLLRGGALELGYQSQYQPMFKKPKRTNEKLANAYTLYANYLAMLVLDVTEMDPKPIPTETQQIIDGIKSIYGDLSFRGALEYVWNLGIPVLPLEDSGAFHGACWRSEKRNVIVLKQKVKSRARWLFDLIHELCHLAQDPKADQFACIEHDEMSKERINSLEEQKASYFAGEIILEGRAEELAKKCIENAQGHVEWLKKSVEKIAKQEDVDVGNLANYLAHRLSLQGINWWGAANNIQSEDKNPWEISRDFLAEKINLDILNNEDKRLLINALSAYEEV